MTYARHPDSVARLAELTDVPIERDAIGAMSINRFDWPVHGYAYGESNPRLRPTIEEFVFPETPVLHVAPDSKPKRRRKPKPKPKRFDINRKPAVKPRYYLPSRWPRYTPPRRVPIRPASGWQPISGSEIDELLEEV